LQKYLSNVMLYKQAIFKINVEVIVRLVMFFFVVDNLGLYDTGAVMAVYTI